MKKSILPIILLSCLVGLSGCDDNNKKAENQPSSSQQTPLPPSENEAKTTDASETKETNETKEAKETDDTKTASTQEQPAKADTGLGITANEYQAVYNAHIQQFNNQMKQDPVRMVPLKLKISGKRINACTMPFTCLDGTMTEDGKYISKMAISGTLSLKTPKSLLLAPVHLMIGTSSAISGATIPEIKSQLDKLSTDTQKRHAKTASTVFKGYRIQFSHPKEEKLVLTVTKEPEK